MKFEIWKYVHIICNLSYEKCNMEIRIKNPVYEIQIEEGKEISYKE